MKKLFCISLVFLLGATLLGCGSNLGGGGGDDDDYDPSKEWVKFAHLDIADAKALVGWPGKIGQDKVDVWKLYKLTQDEQLVEVFPLDSRGNKINIDFLPIEVYNVNNEYLLISNSNDWAGPSQGTYLVDKLDGRVTKIPQDAGYPAVHLSNRKNRGSVVQTDGAGNIYYIGNDDHGIVGERLVKLTVGAGVKHEYASAQSVKFLKSFRVDRHGNIMYYNYQNDRHRYWLNKGVIEIEGKECHNFFTRNGDLYFITSEGEHLEIHRVDADGSYSLNPPIKELTVDSDTKSATQLTQWNTQVINIKDHIYFLFDRSPGYKIYELTSANELNNITTVVESEILVDIFGYDYTDDAIYFYGQDSSMKYKIVKYTPGSPDIAVYNLDNYNIMEREHPQEQKIIALGNGEVLFQGTPTENDRQVLLAIVDAMGNIRKVAETPDDFVDLYKYNHHIVFERMEFSVNN